MKRKDSGISLPFMLLGVAGLAAGVWLAITLQPDAEVSGQVNGQIDGRVNEQLNEQALATVQASLATSQLLPEDFRSVPAFDLIGGDEQPISQSALEGQWNILFFGYTHCPDVCPITLSILKQVVAKLHTDKVPAPQIVFITVDPVRDTPEHMGKYVKFFDPEFVGVSGELNDIHALTRELGIVASFTANEDNPDNYLVDHTASLLLVDPALRVRAKFSPEHTVEGILADYRTLMAELN